MAKKPVKAPSRPAPLPPAPSPVPCEALPDEETGASALSPLSSQGIVSVPMARIGEYLAAYGLRPTSVRYAGEGNLLLFVEALCGSSRASKCA